MSADDLNLSFDPDSEKNEAFDLQDGAADEAAPSRPADGARQATPGEVLFEGFPSSDDAGDFLGLDTELHFSSEAGAHGSIDTGLGVGEESGGAEYAPTAPGAAPEEGAEVYGDAEDFEGDEDDLEQAYEEEFAEDEEYADAEGGPHMGVLFVTALAVGALAVAGAVYGPALIEQYTGGTESTPVATTAGTSATTTSTTDPGTVATGAEGGATTSSTTTTTSAGGGTSTTGASGATAGASGATELTNPTDPTSGGSEDPFYASATGEPTAPVKTGERGSLQRLFSSSTFELVPRESTGMTVASGAETTTGGTPLDGPTGTGGEATLPVERPIPLPGSQRGGEPDAAAEFLSGGMDWASRGDVDVVWRRSEIPLEAMDAPTRVATPHVGTVRVHLAGGDFFEGRLVALGEGNVWIQTKPGRMAFPGDEVASIEALGMMLATADPGAIHAPKRGERVRVRAPGGLIYGHVVRQDESGALTLRTDEGGKVTLEEGEIEKIRSSRAVIVEQ